MQTKPVIMTFVSCAVFVVAGLLMVDNIAGGEPLDVSRSSQTLTRQRKANEPQPLVTHQLATAKPLGPPIAYGYINPGKIVTGSGNFTCEWSEARQGYNIFIAHVSYMEEKYITFVTPAHTIAFPVTGQGDTNAQGENALRISFLSSGIHGQSAFQFITYKIP